MAVISYREALRAAMREELKRDDKVVIMGEEVAQFNGAYKVTEGLLKEFGPDRKSTRLNSSHLTQSRMPSSA